MHLVRRLLQPSQVGSIDAANVHRILRRLHSQQLCVPLRTFRFLGARSNPSAAEEPPPSRAPDMSRLRVSWHWLGRKDERCVSDSYQYESHDNAAAMPFQK